MNIFEDKSIKSKITHIDAHYQWYFNITHMSNIFNLVETIVRIHEFH